MKHYNLHILICLALFKMQHEFANAVKTRAMLKALFHLYNPKEMFVFS